jgi:hypothetical protein
MQKNHDCIFEYINVGADIGGGFANTAELHVMKYHEVIIGPDGDLWKAEVRKDHQRMINWESSKI